MSATALRLLDPIYQSADYEKVSWSKQMELIKHILSTVSTQLKWGKLTRLICIDFN